MSESDILAVQLWWGAAAIAFLAVAMTAAGWNHRYFVRAMFVLASLLALVAIFWRQILSNLGAKPLAFIVSLANSPLAWLVMFVIGIGAVLALTRVRGSPIPKAIPTSVRLQFHPNSINPTNLHLENIWSWYALRHSFIVHEGPSKQFKQGREIESRQWTIFLVFDKPVALKQILVNGNGANLPVVEVKDRGPRHAVIVIAGDIGGVILDINVVV
jgi:hypothetical protein